MPELRPTYFALAEQSTLPQRGGLIFTYQNSIPTCERTRELSSARGPPQASKTDRTRIKCPLHGPVAERVHWILVSLGQNVKTDENGISYIQGEHYQYWFQDM